jgi:hypothetical protein
MSAQPNRVVQVTRFGDPDAIEASLGRVLRVPRSTDWEQESGGLSLVDPLQSLCILLPAAHIDIGTGADHRCGFFVERTNCTRRRTHDK